MAGQHVRGHPARRAGPDDDGVVDAGEIDFGEALWGARSEETAWRTPETGLTSMRRWRGCHGWCSGPRTTSRTFARRDAAGFSGSSRPALLGIIAGVTAAAVPWGRNLLGLAMAVSGLAWILRVASDWFAEQHGPKRGVVMLASILLGSWLVLAVSSPGPLRSLGFGPILVPPPERDPYELPPAGSRRPLESLQEPAQPIRPEVAGHAHRRRLPRRRPDTSRRGPADSARQWPPRADERVADAVVGDVGRR